MQHHAAVMQRWHRMRSSAPLRRRRRRRAVAAPRRPSRCPPRRPSHRPLLRACVPAEPTAQVAPTCNTRPLCRFGSRAKCNPEEDGRALAWVRACAGRGARMDGTRVCAWTANVFAHGRHVCLRMDGTRVCACKIVPMPCHAMQSLAQPCNAMPCDATQSHAMQSHAQPCHVAPR
eukprot:54229-Chlamydomonas_euryale.AAC.2